MHICQAALNAIVVIGEAFMVDAKKMQHRGVVIVPVNRVFDGLPADVIGLTIIHAVFKPRTGHPDGKPIHIVIAASSNLIERRLSERR